MTTPSNLLLRVRSLEAPSEHYEGPTEFGLQDKKKQLLPGTAVGAGTVTFEVEVGVVVEDPGLARFRGPWVHGRSGAQHLYIGWRYVGSSSWINRLKVALPAQTELIQRALSQGHILETDATGPEWGRLKDWHGLNVGKRWTAAAS